MGYAGGLSREFAPDHLHSDECRARPEVTVTILAYPHETWPPAWRGHTEFAPLDCASDAGRALLAETCRRRHVLTWPRDRTMMDVARERPARTREGTRACARAAPG